MRKTIVMVMLVCFLILSLFTNAVMAVDSKEAFAAANSSQDKKELQGRDEKLSGKNGRSGTTLNASVTAQGSWVKKKTYDWMITKSSNVDRPVINPGKTYSLVYTLRTTRTLTSEIDQISARGYVTVSNAGASPTESLQIVSRVQYKVGKGPFIDLPNAVTVIVPGAQLQPGQSNTYPYEVVFTPIVGAQYRTVATITITNHSGHLNVPFGPEPKDDFTLPSTYEVISEDETGTISDTAVCPAGFTCASSHPGGWNLTDSSTLEYTLTVQNVSAPKLQIVELKNTAALTENNSNQNRTANHTVLIFTGCTCTQPK